MQPLGLRSNSLIEQPSDGGVYSEANIRKSELERLAEPLGLGARLELLRESNAPARKTA